MDKTKANSDDLGNLINGNVQSKILSELDNEVPLDAENPLNRLQLGDLGPVYTRLPNFLRIETKPFDAKTYNSATEEYEMPVNGDQIQLRNGVKSTIRWRESKDVATGEIKRQSNAKIIKWSDGSMSLYLGGEKFEIEDQTEMPAVHLFARQDVTLQNQVAFARKFSFRPIDTNSFIPRMVLGDTPNFTQEVKVLSDVGVNPEKAKMEIVKKEKAMFRALAKKKTTQISNEVPEKEILDRLTEIYDSDADEITESLIDEGKKRRYVDLGRYSITPFTSDDYGGACLGSKDIFGVLFIKQFIVMPEEAPSNEEPVVDEIMDQQIIYEDISFIEKVVSEESSSTNNRYGKCLYCKNALLIITNRGYFPAHDLSRHFPNCLEAPNGDEIRERYVQFQKSGDVSDLWTAEQIDEKGFFKIGCPLECDEMKVNRVFATIPVSKATYISNVCYHLLKCPEVKKALEFLKAGERLEIGDYRLFTKPVVLDYSTKTGKGINGFYLHVPEVILTNLYSEFLMTPSYVGCTFSNQAHVDSGIIKLSKPNGGIGKSACSSKGIILLLGENSPAAEAVSAALWKALNNLPNQTIPVKSLYEIGVRGFWAVLPEVIDIFHDFFLMHCSSIDKEPVFPKDEEVELTKRLSKSIFSDFTEQEIEALIANSALSAEFMQLFQKVDVECKNDQKQATDEAQDVFIGEATDFNSHGDFD